MTCTDFLSQLTDYFDGAISPELLEEVRAHTAAPATTARSSSTPPARPSRSIATTRSTSSPTSSATACTPPSWPSAAPKWQPPQRLPNRSSLNLSALITVITRATEFADREDYFPSVLSPPHPPTSPAKCTNRTPPAPQRRDSLPPPHAPPSCHPPQHPPPGYGHRSHHSRHSVLSFHRPQSTRCTAKQSAEFLPPFPAAPLGDPHRNLPSREQTDTLVRPAQLAEPIHQISRRVLRGSSRRSDYRLPHANPTPSPVPPPSLQAKSYPATRSSSIERRSHLPP